jgi:succinate dehydrogenase/fumarate reductase flavoprotein subunit
MADATHLPQAVLDALTEVALPRRMPGHAAQRDLTVSGLRLPVHRCEALVLGSGAAGLRAAVELKRRGVDVVVATQILFWGTSVCSGSDKQTLHTASTGRHGDDFLDVAAAIAAGGAMDADTAYVEAVGSIDALAGLKHIGLRVPEDRFGAVLRYRTDHDEAGRATSCGPRTSRLMVKALAEEAGRLEVPFVDRCTGAALLTAPDGDGRAVCGLLALKPDARTPDNPCGLTVFEAPAVVLATGGPGELYRDSAYPRRCFGSLGLALEAGVELTNLTESQFGISTPRGRFPWNLSGTYAQAMPYIYSVDAAGRERNILADYYRTTQELASNIFRKGYQWPFHAARLLDFGSSLVDLAVHREAQAGRTPYMDFTRNPQAVPGDLPFSLDRLDADVKAYLGRNGALLASPIERLERMNPLAIELYRRQRWDLRRQPLPFTVNNQHLNGGVAVDTWGQSNLPGCYAIGEAAGTHGVTRPGGAALTAGQVFGIRCARHIDALRAGRVPGRGVEACRAQIAACLSRIADGLAATDGLAVRDVRREIQERMSDAAGFICRAEDVAGALGGATALNDAIRARGIAIASATRAAEALLWRQMALTSEAVLTALHHYVAHGGGSRGARALCSPSGTEVPLARLGALEQYRFRPERGADRHVQIRVRYLDRRFVAREVALRELDGLEGICFEKDWARYLTGAIYRDGRTPG